MIGILFKFILILLFLTAATLYLLFRPYNIVSLPFSGKNLKIGRDDYGIATIHVSNWEEYHYALGTVTAEDRLFQITFRCYTVQGRLSEFLGEKTLQFDKYMRELGLKKWAERRAQRMLRENPSEYAIFNLFAQGINDHVSRQWLLPLQFYLTGMKWQNYTVAHIFYLDVFIEWGLSMNVLDQYTRSILLQKYPKEEINWILPNRKEYWAFQSIPIVSDEEIPERVRTEKVRERLEMIKFNPLSVERPIELDMIEFLKSDDATNAWAVSGKYTESGFPILSNDPHLETLIPSTWYQTRINFTQNGKSTYFLARSTPGNAKMFGKTDYYSLGLSICHGDNQDLFRERIEGDKYLIDGVWRNLKIRNETILVKSRSGMRREVFTIMETHRGPIVHSLHGALGSFNLSQDTISLAWTGFNDQWESYSKITRSFLVDNIADLTHFLQFDTKTFYNVNILAITKDNHIITQQSGLHPIRRNAESGTYIKDGTTTQHDWVGIVPAQDRMHSKDPPKGYIIHANNRLAQSGYYGGYLDYTIFTARADRIDQLIQAEIKTGRKIGVDFAKKVMYDTVDVYCRQILPEIAAVVNESRSYFDGFDCDFRGDSYIASIYQVFIYELYHLMKPIAFERFSLISAHQMQQGIFNYIHFAYNGDEAKKKVMRQAWPRATAHLESKFGKDATQWQWGKLNIDTARHIPFRTHPVLSKVFDLIAPGSGNFHTPNVAKMDKLQFGKFQRTHRANIQIISGFADDQEFWCDDAGASENIFSPHYSDQWKKLINNEMIPAYEGVQGLREEL